VVRVSQQWQQRYRHKSFIRNTRSTHDETLFQVRSFCRHAEAPIAPLPPTAYPETVKHALLIGLAVVVFGFAGAVVAGVFNKDSAQAPTTADVGASPGAATTNAKTEVIAEGLEIPWEVAFAPDNRILVTERPGRVRVIQNGQLQPDPILTVQTAGSGEGGLQGMALDPDFAANKFVYLYISSGSGNTLTNRVVRYRDTGSALAEPKTLVDAIPGNNNHNGGRLAFGPDKKLYVTTGDSQEPSLAQDKNSLAGKVLRLNPDGSTPADNPFAGQPGARGEVWSLGHRNPQGLAWDDSGTLYLAEHGPSGDLGQCCKDEVNKIDKGANYGWPEVTGDQKRDGLVNPILQSGNATTWAPAGLSLGPDGRLYFGALRGEHLHAVTLKDGKVTKNEELFKEFGRIRAVVKGPDNRLYITTSNRDGRGSEKPGDDKLIRLALPAS